MLLALPGSAYIYQGEELGLPEVTDIPGRARQDPRFFRTKGEFPGRDGCRGPLPWSAAGTGFVSAERARVPARPNRGCRSALRLRRDHPALGRGAPTLDALRWLGPDGPVTGGSLPPDTAVWLGT